MRKMIVDMALGSLLTVGYFRLKENKEIKKVLDKVTELCKKQ